MRSMNKMPCFLALAVPACLALLAGPVAAEEVPWIEDTFYITVDTAGNVTDSGGSGYNGGEWYYYSSTFWWNQWFYDHPFDEDKWKEIEIEFIICDGDPWQITEADIAVNWSTPEWSAEGTPGEPPLPGVDEDRYIYRDIFYHFSGDDQEPAQCDTTGGIPVTYLVADYNPEWVSIDVSGYDFDLQGTIRHRCVPEPATMCLMALGGLGLLRRR